MKLPIQSRPVLRNINSDRISDALMSGVIASDCTTECAWLAGACGAVAFLGPEAFAGCAIPATATSCRDCISEIYNNLPRVGSGALTGSFKGK
jgi:hypothetical protein